MILLENGTDYKRKYYWSIIWERTKDLSWSFSWNPLVAFALMWILFLFKLSWKLFAIVTCCGGYFFLSQVFDYIAEEFFPSDHLLCIAVLRVQCK